MAFTSLGTVAQAQNKTSASSIAATFSEAVPVGTLLVLRYAGDNITTPNTNDDTGTTEISGIADSQSNTWIRARGVIRGAGTAAAGVVGHVWYCVVTTALGTSDTVTVTLASSRTAKAVHVEAFSFSGGTIGVAIANGANGASTTPSVASGTAAAAVAGRLWIGHTAYERPTSDSDPTRGSDWDAAPAEYGTTGGTASQNVLIAGGRHITTATSRTWSSTHPTSGDWAAIVVALDETTVPDTITVEVRQGTTLIATRSVEPGATWADFDLTLSTGEVAAITDPTALRVVLTKAGTTGGVQVSEVALALTGIEDEAGGAALASSVSGSATTSAALTVLNPLAAAVSVAATVAATVRGVAASLASSVAVAATIVAALTGAPAALSASPGSSVVVGPTLTQQSAALAAIPAGSALTTAQLSVAKPLETTVGANSAVTAALTGSTATLEAAAAAGSTVGATIRQSTPVLLASLTAVGNGTAALTGTQSVLAAAPTSAASVAALLRGEAAALLVAGAATAESTAILTGVPAGLAADAPAATVLTATLSGASASLSAHASVFVASGATLRGQAAALGTAVVTSASTDATLTGVTAALSALAVSAASVSATARQQAAQLAAAADANALAAATVRQSAPPLGAAPSATTSVLAAVRLGTAALAAAPSSTAAATPTLSGARADLSAAASNGAVAAGSLSGVRAALTAAPVTNGIASALLLIAKPLAASTDAAALAAATLRASQLRLDASAAAGALATADLTPSVPLVGTLLCPDVASAPTLRPHLASAPSQHPVVASRAELLMTVATRPAFRLTLILRSRCAVPIQREIHPDNNAVLCVALPQTGLTVEWFLSELAADGKLPGVEATPIHEQLAGTLEETEERPDWLTADDVPLDYAGAYYVGTLLGSAITAQLWPAYENRRVALICRVGQELRVGGTTTVRRTRAA
jgi:hypothetical protein